MVDWKPGDLCQVRRGKRWVDAEVLWWACPDYRVRTEDGRLWAVPSDLRPRPGKRGKLPEPYRIDGLPQRVFEADTEEKRDADARSEGKAPHQPGSVLKPVPKPTTARSKDYLAHVRTFPCCSCGATEAIHAHHVASGGMGAKASDYLTAPLCGRCHGGWHSKGMLPTPVYLNRAESLATMWEAAARCLEEWITREGE